MRFLVDQSISSWVAEQLTQDGHDAIHVKSIGLRDASDDVILDHALKDNRIILSVDTDFGKLVSTMMLPAPSVILFRRDSTNSPPKQVQLLRANLPAIERQLAEGALATFTGYSIRIRSLPIREAD